MLLVTAPIGAERFESCTPSMAVRRVKVAVGRIAAAADTENVEYALSVESGSLL